MIRTKAGSEMVLPFRFSLIRVSLRLRSTSCNVVFGLFLQNTIVQTEIRNFGRENRAIWGGKFPLDYPF